MADKMLVVGLCRRPGSTARNYVGTSAEDQPAAGRSLRHVDIETLRGGIVSLRYRVEDAPSATSTHPSSTAVSAGQ